MTKEEMLKVIYDKVADKTLNFKDYYKFTEKNKVDNGYFYEDVDGYTEWIKTEELIMELNPVIIGDILDYLEENNLSEDIDGVTFDDVGNIKELDNYVLKDWEEKRKPIDEQSTDCIEYIYNLIK